MSNEADLKRARFRTFTAENLVRAENRINLTLFAAQAIPEFWGECCKLLGLPENSWLERVVVEGEPLRPDFLVRQGDREVGWIEVELGGRNEAQLAAYGVKFAPLPIVSVVGCTGNVTGDPLLGEIAYLAGRVAEEIKATNRPAAAVLEFLALQIRDSCQGATRRPFVQLLPGDLADRPWFAAAAAPFSDLLEAGFMVNRPTNARSLSLRLVRGPSVRCRDSFAIITQRELDHLLVPEPAEMERVFCGPLKVMAEKWGALLDRVYPVWKSHVDGRHRIRIGADIVVQHACTFVAIFADLRDLLIPRAGIEQDALSASTAQVFQEPRIPQPGDR